MIYVMSLILFWWMEGLVCLSKKLERCLEKNISRSMLICHTFWEQNGEEKTKNKVVYSTAKASWQ
jgi:hypothetical protein